MASVYQRSAALVLCATALLSGCGGGGSDDAGNTSSYAAQAAWNNLFATTRSWTVSGTGSDRQNYTLGLSITPTTPAAFPMTGVTANRRLLGSSLAVNGISLGTGTSTYYMDTTSDALVGISVEEDCSKPTATTLLPAASATVGASGSLGNWTAHTGCTPSATQVGTGTGSWGVVQDGSIVYLCLTTTSRDTVGTTSSSEEDCFEMNTDGSIGTRARISLTVTAPGVSFTLVARN